MLEELELLGGIAIKVCIHISFASDRDTPSDAEEAISHLGIPLYNAR